MTDELLERFLYEGDIVGWSKPRIQLKGYDPLYVERLLVPDGNTRVEQAYGPFQFHDTLGAFSVVGQGVIYHAQVARQPSLGRMIERGSYITAVPVESTLYAGHISIMQQSAIPGLSEPYFMPVHQGKIWAAQLGFVEEDATAEGLRRFVLGSSPTEESVMEILRGYKRREVDAENARNERENSMYNRGRGDAHESLFGTFGGRW